MHWVPTVVQPKTAGGVGSFITDGVPGYNVTYTILVYTTYYSPRETNHHHNFSALSYFSEHSLLQFELSLSLCVYCSSSSSFRAELNRPSGDHDAVLKPTKSRSFLLGQSVLMLCGYFYCFTEEVAACMMCVWGVRVSLFVRCFVLCCLLLCFQKSNRMISSQPSPQHQYRYTSLSTCCWLFHDRPQKTTKLAKSGTWCTDYEYMIPAVLLVRVLTFVND